MYTVPSTLNRYLTTFSWKCLITQLLTTFLPGPNLLDLWFTVLESIWFQYNKIKYFFSLLIFQAVLEVPCDVKRFSQVYRQITISYFLNFLNESIPEASLTQTHPCHLMWRRKGTYAYRKYLEWWLCNDQWPISKWTHKWC